MTSTDPRSERRDPLSGSVEAWADDALLHALVERAQDIIVVIDPAGIVRYVNAAVEAATGWRPDDVIGRSIMELVAEEDVERALFDLSVYSSEGSVAGSSYYRVRMADGSLKEFGATAADVLVGDRQGLALYARPDDSASPAVLYGLLRGTSAAEMLRPVCDVINWDIHRSRVSIAWDDHLGVQCVGTDLPPQLTGGDGALDTPWAVVRETGTPQLAKDHSALDATRRALAEQLELGAYWIEPVMDDHGQVCALITLWMRAGGLPPEIHTLGMDMARDYTELIVRWNRQQRQLDEAAHRDPLTHVANRKTFVDALESGLRLGAVLYCDLDGFKGVNDSLGHTAGDELLRAVARRIQRCLRTHDLVARIGGDEFAVLTTDVTRPQVLALAERIREAITAPFNLAGTTATVGISIGLAYEEQLLSAELLDQADRGLYRAKTAGSNEIRWSDDPD